MSFSLDISTILQAFIVAGLMHSAKVLWSVTGQLAVLTTRADHVERRVDRLEEKV